MIGYGKGLLFGGVAALALTGAAVADSGRGHHGYGSSGFFGERLFETFDANGDGRLTQEEIDGARASKLAEFDSDEDGSLSLDEYQALWMDAMRERMVDQFQAHDDDGDGAVTVEEFGERFARMVSRLDQDDDGALTMDEMRPRRDGGGEGAHHGRSGPHHD